MVIIVHADVNDSTIQTALGQSEYSYYFVLKEFLPVLDKLGIVVKIRNPDPEVDAIFQICQHLGEPCLFLSFSPPHFTAVNFQCPTFSVFAWEFYDIPDETWDMNQRNDWRFTLRKHGAAITHSSTSVNAVHKAMGADFPIAAIPAPVWDRFSLLSNGKGENLKHLTFELTIKGNPTHFKGLGQEPPKNESIPESHSAAVSFELDLNPIGKINQTSSQENPSSTLELHGIIYTTIFNPDDGRKNWLDILRMFCIAFRDEPQAILVFKIVHHHLPLFRKNFLKEINKLSPFSCQVVLIDSFLSNEDYQSLAQQSTFIVNASLAEGQCIPVMEYMSAGTPAVAPKHTGMEDYLDDSNAFLVKTSLEPATWPQDPRQKIRTLRHRIDAHSLLEAYKESFRVAKEDPLRYQEMSKQATESLRKFCSQEVVEEKLKDFLEARMKEPIPEFVSEDW